MALEGKKITIPDDTPVQLLAAGPTAYDLTVKPGRRVFIGTSASMTADEGFPVESGGRTITVPSGVDVYVLLPDSGSFSYPQSIHYLALPFDGPSGQLSCERLALGSVPTPLHSVSLETLLVEVTGYVRIGGSSITPTDGFEVGPSRFPYLVAPGEQLFAVKHSGFPAAEAYALVSTYIAR
ncbi:hypothetical protein ACPCAJ_02240 [Streptomyces griseoincarnatus]